MNVLVLHTQVPFTCGGAEVLVDGLADALSNRGHQVDRVSLPLSWNPTEGLLTSALAWRLLDLSSFNGQVVDRVICTKYPTWAVRHPNKAMWLIHQHRQAYDLFGTSFSEFTPDATSKAVRERLIEIDRRGLNECRPRYAISKNVSHRLKTYNGIDATALYPPVPRSGLRAEAYEPFILSVARLDEAKRVDKIVNAWENVSSNLNLVVVGDGPNLEYLGQIVKSRNLGSRVSILGRVDDARLLDLYNRCRGVYYAPVDEDYGYSTVEALTAGKPVITAPDSGGTLEFVVDGRSGIVTSLDAPALGTAVDRLADESFARELGTSGPALTADMTWDAVVDALVGV